MSDEKLIPYKLIDGNEQRLYHAKAVLDLHSEEISIDNPYPLYEDGAIDECGAVDIFIENGKVVAYMFFDYATRTRLDIEIGEPLYLNPSISTNGKVLNLEFSRQKRVCGGKVEV